MEPNATDYNKSEPNAVDWLERVDQEAKELNDVMHNILSKKKEE